MVSPTGYTALDLIGYTDRGNYNASANYVKNDLVHYNGNIWRVLVDDTTGITPAEGVNYTIFVELPADATAESIAPVEEATSTRAYTTGKQLYFNDKLYKVIANISVGDTLTVGSNIQLSATVTEQIADLESDLDTQGTTLSSQIQTLSDSQNKRKVILCGDSYVQGIGGNGTTLESVIESLTNWDVRRYYAGGCGYIRANNSNKKMIDVVQDAINDLTTSDKNTVTDVVLCASAYNDTGMYGQASFNEPSFVSALGSINALVKVNFPKARVTVIPALWINATYNNAFQQVFEWIVSGARAIGANYSSRSIMWLQPYTSAVDSGDHIHPSAQGYNIIGANITSVLNGTDASVYSGFEIVTSSTNDDVNFSYYSDHVHIVARITKESGQSFSSLFATPQPLQKLVNFPVPYVKYGDNDYKAFLITGQTTYFPSDWLTEGDTYIIDCDVPYVPHA